MFFLLKKVIFSFFLSLFAKLCVILVHENDSLLIIHIIYF